MTDQIQESGDDPEDDNDQTFVIGDDQDEMRLDKALVMLCPEHSRTRLQDLISNGDVLVDGKPSKQSSLRVKAGQVLSLSIPDPVEATPQPENIPLNIVYEDGDLLVINKPAGLVVHPGAGNWTGTLVNALLYHCGDTLSGIGGVIRPGIVHRLDRETSGLMVVAKSDAAHRGLSEQLADRSLSRTYLAVVWKIPAVKGVIDKPIARHYSNRQRMHIPAQGGREARTHYKRVHVFHESAAIVECDLESGRTHQIRVHMESIGHPLIGDPVYGLQKTGQQSLLKKAGYADDVRDAVLNFPRQALHARRIRFFHPLTDEDMAFESEIPEDLASLISLMDQ